MNQRFTNPLEILSVCLQSYEGKRPRISISKPILEQSYSKYNAVSTRSRIQHLWQFLDTINGTIVYPNTWLPSKTFEFDVNFMEVIYSSNLSDDKNYIITMCRLRKKIYYIGDILDPTGLKIRPNIMRLLAPSYHRDKFPQISLPNTFEDYWQSAVRMVLSQTRLGSSLGQLIGDRSYKFTLHSSKLIQHHHLKKNVYRKAATSNFFEPAGDEPTFSTPSHVVVVSPKGTGYFIIASRLIYRPTTVSLTVPHLSPTLQIASEEDIFRFEQYLQQHHLSYQRN